MNSFLRCFLAEISKTRRTLALAMTVLAPAVVILMMITNYTRHIDYYLNAGGVVPWKYMGETTLVYWSVLFLPLFITLETALLGQLEHTHKNWKLLYTLPVSRGTVYAAKLALCALLVAVSFVLLLVMMIILGNVLQLWNPEFGFDTPIPWATLLRMAGLAYLASGFLIAFHTWLSVRSPSFVIVTGTGIVATMIGIVGFGDTLSYYYPWTIPGTFAMNLAQKDLTAWVSLAIGSLGAVPVVVLGLMDTSRRDVL